MPATPSPTLRTGPNPNPPQATDQALASRLLALYNRMRVRLGEVVIRRLIVETDLVVARTASVAGRPVPSTFFPASKLTPLVGSPVVTQTLVFEGGSGAHAVDSNSCIDITFPSTFRNSLITFVAYNGDASVDTNLVFSAAPTFTPASLSSSGTIRVWDANTNSGLALGTLVRVNWFAMGT